MKRTLLGFGIGAVLAIIPQRVQGQTAQVTLVNNSVRMFPGDCSCGFGLTWTLSFSSSYTEDPTRANGELAPLPQAAGFHYWSYLILEDPSLYASTTYAELDLPMSGDANGNGVSDFFDVDQAVSAGSSGTYPVPWSPGHGELLLTWTRAAGSRLGGCQLYMVDPILGEMGPFNHSFELFAYDGELNYSRGSNSVTGALQIAQQGSAFESLEGSVALERSPTNRFDQLTLSGGAWTNQAGMFAYSACELIRDAAHPAVFHGPLESVAGNFRHWTLSIQDTNDVNGNGIPDLSDDLVVSPLRRPFLMLSFTSTNLMLNVSGEIGRTHLVQQTADLNADIWNTVRSVVLTNDPHVIALPLPDEAPAFWRVRVE